MQTKLDMLINHARAGRWRYALRIAARFPQLGEHRADILRGHEAHSNPGFYRQLGHDPEALIAAGIAALQARYNLNPETGEPIMAAVKKQPNAKVAPAQPAPIEAAPAPRRNRVSDAAAARIAAAEAGQLPEAPDFTPPSHKPFRKRLAVLVAMVEAGDIDGLRADTTEPKSSSRVMLCRYRDLAIKALAARAASA